MLTLQTAYISRIGSRRRNEDACGYWTSPQGCCWVVSDGAGGHGSGDRAAQIVVSTVLERFSAQPQVGEEYAIYLLEAAQAAVMADKRADPGGDDMHATAAALLIDADQAKAVWSHVGDTRIYLFRNGEILHRTRDHSLVQSMIDAGYGSPDMIRQHPQRSLLTSAIGNAEDLALSVSGAPLDLQLRDTFLICSDGWWEHVDEAQMCATLASAASCEDWLNTMAALVEKHDNPQNDNYTAVAVIVAETQGDTTVLLP